jgi:uncharacterized protein (DUF2126 family)
MKVTRIWESPRVTKPYTEDQWADVLALGEPGGRATWWRATCA